MVARAVSARESLTPLAVLVPIAATPLAGYWALSADPATTGAVFAALVLVGGLAAIGVAGRHTIGARVAVVTAILTWIVAFLALPFWFAASIQTSVCGKDVAAAWGWLPPTASVLAFLVVGSWGLRTHRGFSAVPMAGLLGVIVLFLLYAAVPGVQGVCET